MSVAIDLPTGDVLERLRRRPEVLGALLVGSAVRGTYDHESDRDIEVVVEDSYYQEQVGSDRVTRDGRDELMLVPLADFKQKKLSPRDVDHWPYQTCVVLFDRHGAIAQELPLINTMAPEVRRARIRLHIFELLFLVRRIPRLCEQQVDLQLYLVAAQAATVGVRLAFVHAGFWPPLPHATLDELAQLGRAADALASALTRLLRKPDRESADELLHTMSAQLGDDLPETAGDEHLLTCDVTGADFRIFREQYGTL